MNKKIILHLCADLGSDAEWREVEEFDDDVQCYTIVDKINKIRGADNYYTKFNYLDMTECKEALTELYNEDMEISRRNRIVLSEYEIKG